MVGVVRSVAIVMQMGMHPDEFFFFFSSRRRDTRCLSDWSSDVCSSDLLGRPVNASFLFGSPELYEWAHRNPRLRMARTEIINDPVRIAANPAMLSINMALQIDLFTQVNASFVRGAVYSGFGGQPDFVAGALHSPGGHAVVALHSWHDKTDTSSVLPILTSPVTSFQHSAMVSEQGCAELFGWSEHDQARLIIERVADPRAREDLIEAAGTLGLIRAHQPADG